VSLVLYNEIKSTVKNGKTINILLIIMITFTLPALTIAFVAGIAVGIAVFMRFRTYDPEIKRLMESRKHARSERAIANIALKERQQYHENAAAAARRKIEELEQLILDFRRSHQRTKLHDAADAADRADIQLRRKRDQELAVSLADPFLSDADVAAILRDHNKEC